MVVCPDGELYEYTSSITAGPGAADISWTDALTKLKLAPQEYIPYAYYALREILRRLEARGG